MVCTALQRVRVPAPQTADMDSGRHIPGLPPHSPPMRRNRCPTLVRDGDRKDACTSTIPIEAMSLLRPQNGEGHPDGLPHCAVRQILMNARRNADAVGVTGIACRLS